MVEVIIYRKGTITVTFSRHREALLFEKHTVAFTAMGFNLTASRSSIPVLRTPSDVVVDGLYASDKEEVIELVGSEGGILRRLEVVERVNKGSLVVSFAKHSEAEAFVKRRKYTMIRENSNIAVSLAIEWGLDFNTKKERKEEHESAKSKNSNQGKESTVTAAAAAAVSSRLGEIEKSMREDRRAATQAFEQMNTQRDKQRREDQMMIIQTIAESNANIMGIMGASLAHMADKQATIACLSNDIADVRGEKMMITMQIVNAEASNTPEQAAKAIALKAKEAVLDRELRELKGNMSKIIMQKFEVPALPPPSVNLIEYNPKQTNKVSRRKRKANTIATISPNKQYAESLALKLKGNENKRSEIAKDEWNHLRVQMEETINEHAGLWLFKGTADTSSKVELVGKLYSFNTIFNKTVEGDKAEDIIK